MAKTNLGKVSVTPRGEWVQGTMYARLDVVSRSGGSYMSIVDNNYSPPGTAGAWMQVAKIGKDGRSLIVLNNGNIGYWDSAAQQWVDTGISANTATLDPSNIGLTDVHTNINSLDNPTLTMQDPEDPSKMVVKTVATIEDIPAPSPTIDLDVSAMFTANVELTHFAARMVQYPGKLPLIRIFCEDTSGEDNTLILTVARGFGSFVDHTGSRAIAQPYIDENGSVAFDTITISPETQLAQSVITVSPKLHEFNITYWVGAIEDVTTSYWVDAAGVYHVFTAENTPIDNFSTNENYVSIDGSVVNKGEIIKLNIGADYENTTSLGQSFIRDITNLIWANFNNLRNVTVFRGTSFSGISVEHLDFSAINKPTIIPALSLIYTKSKSIKIDFRNATVIGYGLLLSSSLLESIDLSSFVVLQQIGGMLLSRSPKLTKIQLGSVDWSTIAVIENSEEISFQGTPNVATSTIYADTQALADAFKSKFPNVSNWAVVINEAA